MSLRGRALARCPKGCEPEELEVWSFVRGSEGPLREALLAGELNLVLCSECQTPYYPECTVVYADQAAEIVAFVFPESYRAEEDRWRAKMAEDFAAMREALAAGMPLVPEPSLFFGMEELRRLLLAEQELEDEVQVAGHVAKGLGLGLKLVARSFARGRGLPRLLPQPAKGAYSRAATLAAVEKVLGANGALEGYARWRDYLRSGAEDPPLESA